MRYRFGLDLALLGHRAWLAVGLGLGLTWLWTGAGHRLDTGLSPTDTEGASMAVSRQILRGGSVSREALIRTGPVAAMTGAALTGFTGGQIRHDDQRRLALISVALTALIAALWSFRLTFSVTGALAAFLLAAVPLGSEATRLGQGLELCSLLAIGSLATMPAGGVASFLRALAAGFLLGLLTAQSPALGVLLLLVTVAASLATMPGRAGTAGAAAVVAVLGAASLALADRPPGLGFAVAAAALGIAWATRQGAPRPSRFLGDRDLALLGSSTAIWAVAVLGVLAVLGLPAWALGSSLLREFRLAAPTFAISPTLAVSCVASLALCSSPAWPWRGARSGLTIGRAAALAGLAASAVFACVADRPLPLASLPWLWALIGSESRPDPAPSIRSSRILLSLAIAVCALASVPTPKSLLACLAAIGLHDAIQRFRALAAAPGGQPVWLGRLVAGVTLVALAGLAGRGYLTARATSDDVVLGLPGAQRLRVPPSTAESQRRLVATLERSCDVWLAAPTLDRWTFWIDPSSGLQNLHSTPEELDEATQASILARLSASERPCAVRWAGNDVDGRTWKDHEATPLGRGLVKLLPRVEVIDAAAGYELLRR